MLRVAAVDEINLPHFRAAIAPDDRREILNPGGSIFALGAIEDGAAVGVVVFEAVSAVLLIKEFFVQESARGRGVGTALLKETVAVADETGLSIAFHMNIAPDGLETDPFAALFRQNSFHFYPDKIDRFACTLGELGAQPWNDAGPSDGVFLCTFNELDNAAVEQFRRRTLEARSDYLPESFSKQMILPGLSIAAVEKHSIVAATLIEAVGRELSLTYNYVKEGHLPDLLACFSRCLALAQKSLPPDVVVRFNTINPATKKLLLDSIPDVRPVTVGYTAAYEQKEVSAK